MRLVLALGVLLFVATAHAGTEKMNLAIGGGIAMANAPGWAIRFGETTEVSDGDGAIYGAIAGYDYWRGADGDGFHIPIGGFAGVRAGAVTSTLGLGVGVLALESWHGQDGFGIVPQAAATIGFQLDDVRTVVIDARLQRHVLAGSDDFTTWSVLLMIGRTMGH